MILMIGVLIMTGAYKMRTKFTVNEDQSVTLQFTDIWGTDWEDTFSVYADGLGYVRKSDGRQVCDKLACNGETLMSTSENLLHVIKREYRRLKRDNEKAYNFFN